MGYSKEFNEKKHEMVYLNVGILFKIIFIGLFSAFTTASWVNHLSLILKGV